MHAEGAAYQQRGSAASTCPAGPTVALETRIAGDVADGSPLTIASDADQLDQLLVNLVANTTEASLETGGAVRVAWSTAGDSVAITVDDDGHGVADTSNLFVLFFTTKPTGSGTDLVLARQIAEAHGGTLVLRNRKASRGAEAVLTLPTRSS